MSTQRYSLIHGLVPSSAADMAAASQLMPPPPPVRFKNERLPIDSESVEDFIEDLRDTFHRPSTWASRVNENQLRLSTADLLSELLLRPRQRLKYATEIAFDELGPMNAWKSSTLHRLYVEKIAPDSKRTSK